jgi:hypothetical protein
MLSIVVNGDCVEDDLIYDLDTCDENNWFDPADEPSVKIDGTHYENNRLLSPISLILE